MIKSQPCTVDIHEMTEKALLKEYAKNNGYLNLRYYVDDGYTGTNFNRPDFQRMMEDVVLV